MPLNEKVTRGSITVVPTGEIYEFLFNPTQLQIGGSSNLNRDSLPGASHELVHWASSKAKDIQVSLALSSEMRVRLTGHQIQNARNPVPGFLSSRMGDTLPFSLQPEIDFLMSLVLPMNPASNRGEYGPPKVVFNFGQSARNLVCTVADVNVTITEWGTKLWPTKANATLSLVPVVSTTVYREDVWRSSGGRL